MTDELKKYLNKIHKVPDGILGNFLDCWKIKTATKKDTLTHSDITDKYLYFTTKGIQKAYYIKDGTEFNIAFTYPYAFTCVPESFLTQKPSKYTYQCITNSEFLVISYNDFFYFVENHHEFETLLRKTLLGTLNGVVNRYHRLLTLTIEERFLDFMRNSPTLINQINHKEIANYLKIDPTNFSKLLNSVKV